MSVSEPGKIITPWAESGLKNPIPPAANPATGRAGFDQGFSAINMTAKEAGGIPPFGQDFNGIFYDVTNILRYMQAGGQPTFSSALATAIGGYPKGAMVLGSDGVTLWQSKVGGNFTDPDVDPDDWGTFDIGLKAQLAAPGGAGLVGGLPKPVTWAGFAGGADPTGGSPSDLAFASAALHEGDVRVDGIFTLTNPINRTKSIMELPPGSSVTPNKILGGDTTLGSGIPTKTMYGRMVIRDSDGVYDPNDGFLTDPDMGQALRIDSKAVQGQCGMFVSADRARPIIGPSAYVGIHSKHNQSLAAPKTWAINPIIVKNVRASDLPPGVDSETIGMEISVANNTNERGQPQGAGMVEGLFVSYVALQNEGSTAITTGGLTAGWRSALWLDGVTPQGTHIFLRDENSSNAGARCGIDTTGVSAFSDAAVLLGRGHSLASLDTGGAIRPMVYVSSANEIVHGNTLPHRFLGSTTIFDHTIRPGSDNVYDYGSAVHRGRTAYFGTGAINTSDERHKPIISTITDELLDAWADVDWSNRFKFDDAIAEKSEDGARWHFGLIAQRVRDVLLSHGIDGRELGLLCHDKWDDQFEEVQINLGEMAKKSKTVKSKKTIKSTVKESRVVKDGSGKMVLVEVDVIKEEPVLIMEYVKDGEGNFVVKEDGTKMTVFVPVEEEVVVEYDAPAVPVYESRLVTPAGDRYGIRYEEALSLEAAYQRRNYQRLLSRIEALESN